MPTAWMSQASLAVGMVLGGIAEELSQLLSLSGSHSLLSLEENGYPLGVATTGVEGVEPG